VAGVIGDWYGDHPRQACHRPGVVREAGFAYSLQGVLQVGSGFYSVCGESCQVRAAQCAST
jgi:hypothetical protein